MVKFKRHLIKNGLNVLLMKDKAVPNVMVNIAYNVGARDEEEDKTGLAHLFEHLMFSGSKNISNFDSEIQRVGGSFNGFTSNDFTDYFTVVPKQNYETSLWLESDRMLSINLSEKHVEVQKKVVCEEFKQMYLNQPYGDVWHILRKLVYKDSPYQWPTIGKNLEQIQEVSIEALQTFYRKHYTPSNSTLTVAGDFDEEEMLDKIRFWFEEIPAGLAYKRNLPKEQEQKTQRREKVYREIPQDRVYIVWVMPEKPHADFYAMDLISDVFSNGESGRLHQKLVKEKEVCSSVNAYHTGSIDQGMFVVEAAVNGGIEPEQVEALIADEIKAIQTEEIESKEFQKVKNKLEAAKHFSEMTMMNRVIGVNYFEIASKAEDYNNELSKYMHVSTSDIMRVSNVYLSGNKASILYYLSAKNK